MADNVYSPAHYADSCSIECIDTMIIAFGYEETITYCIINAYKYIWRWKNKNGIEDLKKADWYLDKAAELYKILYEYEDEEEYLFVDDKHKALKRLVQDTMNKFIEEDIGVNKEDLPKKDSAATKVPKKNPYEEFITL